jgi:hypothetical protein
MSMRAVEGVPAPKVDDASRSPSARTAATDKDNAQRLGRMGSSTFRSTSVAPHWALPGRPAPTSTMFAAAS